LNKREWGGPIDRAMSITRIREQLCDDDDDDDEKWRVNVTEGELRAEGLPCN
jgi:hypothetical protein